MLFAIICQDKPGMLQTRLDTRPTHLEHLKSLGEKLKGAGPTLDGEGKPNGSLVIIEADDQATADAFAAADPYARVGLFASVSVRPWNWVLANPYQSA